MIAVTIFDVMEKLTIPAMINPPTVPCEPIEAVTTREINEIWSSVVNSLPNWGIIVIGEAMSAEGVIAVDIWKGKFRLFLSVSCLTTNVGFRLWAVCVYLKNYCWGDLDMFARVDNVL